MSGEDGVCNKTKIIATEASYVLEEAPHLSDYIPDLPSYSNPLQNHPAYSSVKQYFVNEDDSIIQEIVVNKNSSKGTHFLCAGPRQKVYFEPHEALACMVTCGGLYPGVNTVIRELVCGLHDMYGVHDNLGIEGGYKGFYYRNTIPLTPKVVNDIHRRGGTILGTSRGVHDTSKIVDSIQDRGINQVIDKSFGFDTAVDEARQAINAAHVEAESVENGIGVVKLMGRNSGFLAMHATLASRMWIAV